MDIVFVFLNIDFSCERHIDLRMLQNEVKFCIFLKGFVVYQRFSTSRTSRLFSDDIAGNVFMLSKGRPIM